MNKEHMKTQKTNDKMVDLHTNISITTLIISNLNIPVKRQKLDFKKSKT